MIRLGCVNYINALPFTLPFQKGHLSCDIEFVYGLPSELNRQLHEGTLDGALTSSLAYLEGEYSMLPGYGIAGKDKILSVNLYTQLPLSSLSGMRVGLTHHSATSIALLKLLCTHFWHISPQFEPLNREEPWENYAAFLLIGDEALQHLSIPGFIRIDLGEAWHFFTRSPFAYALFTLRKPIALQDHLERALTWSEKNQDHLFETAAKRSALPIKLIEEYYSLLHYRLHAEDMEGLEKFNHLSRATHVSKVCP